jgi:hypothetical protein
MQPIFFFFFSFFFILVKMSSLSDISTYDNASASITSRRRSSSVKTIPREEHTSYLTDTAGAVREVAKKLGKKKKKKRVNANKLFHCRQDSCQVGEPKDGDVDYKAW